jgi:hypothetical protein
MNFPINIEQWRLIDGYDNFEISSHGRVRNNKTSRIMKLQTHNKGYVLIGLTKDKKQKLFLIHRLVGFAFLEKKDENIEVDHIDHNRANNMVNNLRWTTRSINGRNTSISKRNTSGHQGVHFNKTMEAWFATWTEEKQRKKYFSVKKHGEEQAKQLAINYRKEMAEANGYLV